MHNFVHFGSSIETHQSDVKSRTHPHLRIRVAGTRLLFYEKIQGVGEQGLPAGAAQAPPRRVDFVISGGQGRDVKKR